MSRVLVGTTIPAFAMTDEGNWWWWCFNARRLARAAEAAGHEVSWLAVCQEDGRGRELFEPLLKRLSLVPGSAVWWFSVDTGDDEVTTPSRLAAICTGRNLIIERANREGHDWIYFADSDVQAPDDVLPRLLEVGWPVVGAHVPTYCLDGPRVLGLTAREGVAMFPEDADTRLHWTTAGSLLVAREVFRRVPWRHDPDADLTDDPATQAEMERLGWPTVVRHDVVCRHHPESIGPLEQRNLDLAVYR